MAKEGQGVEMEMGTPGEANIASPAAWRIRQHLAAFAMCIGAIGTGSTLVWTSVVNAELQCPTNASASGPDPCYSESQLSWVAACMPLGALAIALPVGRLLDVLGRKGAGLCLAPLFVAGWACLIWGNSLAWLCVGRLLTGAMGGGFNVLAPIYIAEISQKEIRGALGGYFQLMLNSGILYTYLLGLGAGLFWTSVACALVPMLSFAACILLPESPLYLLKKGKDDRARQSLRWLRGPHHDLETELLEAKVALEEDRRNQESLRKAFSTRAAQRGIVIGLGVIMCFQLNGINAVLFYTSTIFERATGSSIAPAVSSVTVGAIQVLATLTSALVVDRVGRRPLLVASDAVMALCTLLLGVFFYLDARGGAADLSWLPLTSLCVFVVAFSLGLGTVTWVLLGELFAPSAKGVANSLCCIMSWLLTFFITKFFTDLNAALGIYGTFWIFSGISVVGTAFIFFAVPETKDKSLEDVQRQLSGKTGK